LAFLKIMKIIIIKKIIFLIFIGIIFLPKILLGENLDQAISKAKQHSLEIKIQKIQVNILQKDRDKIISEFFPAISANINIGQRNSYYEGQTYDRNSSQNIKEIKFDQPIFDGFSTITKFRESGYQIKSINQKTQQKISETSLKAIEVYCNLYRLENFVKIYHQNYQLSNKIFQLLQRRNKLRVLDNSDIIKFSFDQKIIEEKYFESLNKLNIAKIEYENVIGNIQENLPIPQVEFQDFNNLEIEEKLINENFNIKSQYYKYLASRANVNLQKTNFSPKISFIASASKQEKVAYLNNADLNSKAIFLNFTIPIFQKGVEFANFAKAKLEQDLAFEEYQNIKKNIFNEIKKTFQEYNFIQKSNQRNLDILDLAKKRLKILQQRSSLKIDDPIDNLQANIDKNDREINLLNSQIDKIICYYKIKYLLGDLDDG